MFKFGEKPVETLPVSRFDAGLKVQLPIDFIYDAASLISANRLQVTDCQRGKLDPISHGALVA
jgi:hypothetical protein